MKVFLIIVLLVVGGIFIWQLVLFVRDLIRKIKQRKMKKAVDNKNDSAESSAGKE